MSIAILAQVSDDMRRLAVAGSAVAPGDFRLKKHIAPLEAAGAKAPVFATVAAQVKAVVESTEKSASLALLELASFLNAVLYTQGETAVPGALEPIETTELDLAGAAQVSARTLKPLLEALTNTGSGRMELIKDAHERGAFKDPRLVKPSLAALDDGYGEIADFIAAKVLPLYGRAILPELRGKFNAKGKGGDARRLKVLHSLDPAGTRELVLKAVEEGSKETKVAAAECLGVEDLQLIHDLTKAKAQDVRSAAYQALATINHPDATKWLVEAVNPKIFNSAYQGVRLTKNPAVLKALHAATRSAITDFRKAKDKKEIGTAGQWMQLLECAVSCHEETDAGSEAVICEFIDVLHELDDKSGDGFYGPSMADSIAFSLAHGTQKMKECIAASRAKVPHRLLRECVQAAVHCRTPRQVYDEYAVYFSHPAKTGLKGKELADAQESVISRVDDSDHTGLRPDPRWTDLAIRLNHHRLMMFTLTPGDPKAIAWLENHYAKAKIDHLSDPIFSTMIAAGCPLAAEAIVETLEKRSKKIGTISVDSLLQMIPDLPKTALPLLEAAVLRIPETSRDKFVRQIEELRSKPDATH